MRYAAITDRLAGLGSDKWAVHWRAKSLCADGVPVIMLTIGEPDVPTPAELIEAATRAMLAGRTGYSSGRGEEPVLAALAAKYSARTGRTVGVDQLMYFPGTQTALYAVMQGLAETGTEVLVGDPLYATYDGVIRASGARRVSVPLRREHGFHMLADDVEAMVSERSRVILINTPHNPTGAVLTRDEIGAIGEVAEAHDLWIVSDEVYESIIFDGEFASPFDDARLAQRTVVVSSLSKSHAVTGFRAGWCVGPAEFTHKLLPLSEAMLFGAQPFIADMAAIALSRTFPVTGQMREAYRRRAETLVRRLGNTTGLKVMMPQGGMFAMVDITRLGIGGEAFAAGLLEQEQVAVMPGEAFGTEGAGLVRVSLTVPDDDIEIACDRIIAFVERLTAGAA
ncbi:MAG: pyridoxal phosphate-dependent aminotransferase [Hyphomicrobiaceae bacterium]|nr:pyridoxal phosphate-dependent aminotransferase [Hyphomicrobiaceae bacterium]